MKGKKIYCPLTGLAVLSIFCFQSSFIHAQERQNTSRADECITIFNDVLRQVDVNYVDTLNYEGLTETAINAMLR